MQDVSRRGHRLPLHDADPHGGRRNDGTCRRRRPHRNWRAAIAALPRKETVCLCRTVLRCRPRGRDDHDRMPSVSRVLRGLRPSGLLRSLGSLSTRCGTLARRWAAGKQIHIMRAPTGRSSRQSSLLNACAFPNRYVRRRPKTRGSFTVCRKSKLPSLV